MTRPFVVETVIEFVNVVAIGGNAERLDILFELRLVYRAIAICVPLRRQGLQVEVSLSVSTVACIRSGFESHFPYTVSKLDSYLSDDVRHLHAL